ncbi:MAG: hypothetical protein KME19_08935 [Microcoleus vaginatus WJT46-NPBG5]|jgi:hypothetical protein|nr:hypothetical protein [Microcoleus vaginatus WJT46-NPBG5]MBW4680225.1 hypothetical protein [Microcoleus vaginatus WJT46-NPBG5]
MVELESRTLTELKALCREYSCFKGYSFFTRKADLIDFMANRIATLAEVTGVVMPVPVPISQVTISGFVAEPAPKEPVPFEEEPEEQPDEWVDPDDQLSETPVEEYCPHCESEAIKLIGVDGDVWRCSRCSAIGYTGDLAEGVERYAPDPFVLFDSSEESKRMNEWHQRQARYALEKAALEAFKKVAPAWIQAADFQDLIKRKLSEAIFYNKIDCFSHRYMPEFFRRCLGAYPFNVRTPQLQDLWSNEGRKLLEEIVTCERDFPSAHYRIAVKRPSIRVPIAAIAKDGESDRRGGDPRRNIAQP